MAYNGSITPYATMTATIQLYTNIVHWVTFFYKQLKLEKYEKKTGRKLANTIINTIALAIFKQLNTIATKKAIYRIFEPRGTYKTMVVNMNRFALIVLVILKSILLCNRKHAHPIKHTDATDIPVCLSKNANRHRTMRGLARWGYSTKGLFYGLKMHITTDLKRRVLSVKFTCGNVHETKVFTDLNKDLLGLFVVDAAYVSEKLAKDFNIEGKRLIMAKPRKNMKKVITPLQYAIYNTRMLIELNFRNLKLFYGLITSLPRSVNGYMANYIYSLLAYHVA